MDEHISVCRIFPRYFNFKVTRGNDGLTEGLREFCSSKNRENLKTLIRNYCHYTWQRETDSNKELTDYCGKNIGNRFLSILDKNSVFYQEHSQLLRILSYNYGLNELKHKCWNEELPLCMCGKYDTPSHFIFSCKEIEKGFIDILKQEIIDRSLIALINCSKDRAIMALDFFSKQNSAFLDSCDNSSTDTVS